MMTYEISFNDKKNIKAYVSSLDGKFQTVRHRNHGLIFYG